MQLPDIGNEAPARRTRQERGIYAASLDSPTVRPLVLVTLAKIPGEAA